MEIPVMRKHRMGGFTLIEVLAVLVLVAAVLAAAVPAFFGLVREFEMRAAIERVQSTLLAARLEALRANGQVLVSFRPNLQQMVISSSDSRAVVSLDAENLRIAPGQNDVELAFNGDGTTNGGRVVFKSRQGIQYVLTVRAENGRTRLEKE